MTFREFFYSEYIYQCLITFISGFAEIFSILTVILIATCFMGRNAKLTKKCLPFFGGYFFVGIIEIVYDLYIGIKQLKEHQNRKGKGHEAEKIVRDKGGLRRRRHCDYGVRRRDDYGGERRGGGS